MAAKSSSVKFHKSKRFTTPAFRAVFPNLTKPDQFGSYGVGVDCLENPEIEEMLLKQAEAFLPEAMEKVGSKKAPGNDLVKEGEIKKGDRKGETFRRIDFKMKSTRQVRKGDEMIEVPQKPLVVDSKMNEFDKVVFGGSLVKVGYCLQYTVTGAGAFLSAKLLGVQVIEYVGPNGQVKAGDLFEEEEGYVDDGAKESVVDPESDALGEDSDDELAASPPAKKKGHNW